jgi:hypothetical protein
MIKTIFLTLVGIATLGPHTTYATAKPKFKIDGDCITIYKKRYLKGKSHKAFAMSTPLKDLYSGKEIACGGHDGNRSLAEAKRRALVMCNGVKARKTVAGKCRIVDSK